MIPPIKKYVMDESLSWEERYRQLEAHHEKETKWYAARWDEALVELEKIGWPCRLVELPALYESLAAEYAKLKDAHQYLSKLDKGVKIR